MWLLLTREFTPAVLLLAVHQSRICFCFSFTVILLLLLSAYFLVYIWWIFSFPCFAFTIFFQLFFVVIALVLVCALDLF